MPLSSISRLEIDHLPWIRWATLCVDWQVAGTRIRGNRLKFLHLRVFVSAVWGFVKVGTVGRCWLH